MQYGDLVSVIVPVYNRADRIGRAVGSITSQSYRNLEIILVDDCSQDDLASAVARLNDPRIRLIRRERNGGAGAARNTGVSAAQSEWIAFVDSDDMCIFDRIERQVRAVETLPSDHVALFTSTLFYTQSSEQDWSHAEAAFRPDPANPRQLSGDVYEETLRNNFVHLTTMLINRQAFLDAGGFDERLRNNEDWDFTLRLAKQGKFRFMPEPLYLTIRRWDGSASSGHISMNDHYSARSYVRVAFKLRRAGVPDSTLVGHHLSAARHLIRIGRLMSARRYLRRAFATQPMSPALWRLYLVSRLPRLYAWYRRRDNRVM